MEKSDLPVDSIPAAEFVYVEGLTQNTTEVRMVMLIYFSLHPGISGLGSFLLL